MTMADLWNRVCREIPPGTGCQLIPQGKDRWVFQAGSLSWGPGKPEEIIPQAIREGAKKGWPRPALASSPKLPSAAVQAVAEGSKRSHTPSPPELTSFLEKHKRPWRWKTQEEEELAPSRNVWASPSSSKLGPAKVQVVAGGGKPKHTPPPKELAPSGKGQAPSRSPKLLPAREQGVAGGGRQSHTPAGSRKKKRKGDLSGWKPLF